MDITSAHERAHVNPRIKPGGICIIILEKGRFRSGIYTKNHEKAATIRKVLD